MLRPTRSLGLGGAGEQQQGTRNGVSPSWNTARRCDGMFHGCLVQRPAASDLPPFTAAFIAGNRFAREHGGPIKMSSRQIGEPLRVPSGRVIVGDPGLIDFADPPPPCAREAPVGESPVKLALADLGFDGTRVTCARVRFAAPAGGALGARAVRRPQRRRIGLRGVS
ncbi:MAG: hypothetical protein JNK56_07670 [Myxococcales bacterium]|nr:hypothetical protein [Myxococcales bacterium]